MSIEACSCFQPVEPEIYFLKQDKIDIFKAPEQQWAAGPIQSCLSTVLHEEF